MTLPLKFVNSVLDKRIHVFSLNLSCYFPSTGPGFLYRLYLRSHLVPLLVVQDRGVLRAS